MAARAGRRSAVVLLLIALAAALAGCRATASVSASDDVTRELALPSGTAVRVETFNGGITVTPGDGEARAVVHRRGEGTTRADAERDRDAIAVTFELVDDVAVLRAVYSPSPASIPGNRGADVDLVVPEGTPVTLETSNGPVDVAAVGADVDIRTSNGPVDVAGANGQIVVDTSNGPVTVIGQATRADVHTSNGALVFAGSIGPGTHRFDTSNGPLEIRLPSGAAFAIDAATASGTITTEFPVVGEHGERELRGTVGGSDACSILARTSNGPLTLAVAR